MREMRLILASLLLCLCVYPARADRNDRGIASLDAKSEPFLSEGGWMAGGAASISSHSNENYRVAILGGINSDGYGLRVKPSVIYGLADDLALGVSAVYKRDGMNLNSAELEMAGVSLDVEKYISLKHHYGGAFFLRKYLTLGNQGRFALFADASVQLTGGQARLTDRQSGSVVGTWQQSWDVSFGVNPGLAAYVSDHLVLGASVGIFNIDYRWTRQVHNQVYHGNSGAFTGSYAINLMDLSVGLYYSF